MNTPVQPERRIVRPALAPIFAWYFVAGTFGGLVALFPDTSLTLRRALFVSAVAASLSIAATLYFWFTAAVLSSDGVEAGLFRRRLLWQDLSEVQTFPFLTLLLLRFRSATGKSRRLLIFQRRRGEFRDMLADLISRDSLAWKLLSNS